MQVLASQTPQTLLTSSPRCGRKTSFLLGEADSLTVFPSVPRRILSPASCSPRAREALKLAADRRISRIQAVNVGTGSYEDVPSNDEPSSSLDAQNSHPQSKNETSPPRNPYFIPAVILLCSCFVAFAFALVTKGPSLILKTLAKSGFTAAFSLIFVSEIGDKTFFIAALLAMQYEKALVLLGSMAALSLMTVLSVLIGRIFQSVPAQFQTTLPVGEYTAAALLLFFGIKSIKDAWDAPAAVAKSHGTEGSDEFVEAEELVKEKVSKRLTNPLEVLWKSFSLIFFAEWGDRSMLATIALGAAQSPWGVATGAITGHLIATSIAIIGGAFLATYVSEKLVGYIGGALFLVFAAATFFGVF